MPSSPHNVCVFGPALFLTVTIEPTADDVDGDELHFHPGGQGVWIARALRRLGERPVLVAPVGGESGRVLGALLPLWNVELSAVEIAGASPAYLHDRRSGERDELARSRVPALDRHEVDDLYNRVLERAAAAGLCVVTGRSEGDEIDLELYRRLGADLASTGVRAIGDLHGRELDAFLEGGPLEVLKVSDADLVQDGELGADAALPERVEALRHLQSQGARRIVLSAAKGPTVGLFDGRTLLATPPALEAVDGRGAGDSMTAGLTAGLLRDLGDEALLRMGCASGAANVTRKGLGDADPALVDRLAERVAVEVA